MSRVLVLACGALIKEVQAIRDLNDIGIEIECLPASFHLHPERIAPELRNRLEDRVTRFDRVLVGYGDCGTAGEIDDVCAEFGASRLDGAHCYEFFAGTTRFHAIHNDDPTVFYLTDFLARHFDRFVMVGLGITEHPELLPLYFGNYTRLIYLAQTNDPALDARAESAAVTLGLSYERISTGYGELSERVVEFARSNPTVEPIAAPVPA